MKHLRTYEEVSIRDQYQKYGADEYYKQFGDKYVNPHEPIIRKSISYVDEKWDIDFSKTLDLAAGKGEATKILNELGYKNIEAIDPYTSELYKKETGKKCEVYSFDDIQKGVLKGRHYTTIVCSFALHLADKSKLPVICYNLSQICDNLLILTPHKRPEIKEEWGFILEDEIVIDKVRTRLYKSIYK